MVAWLRGRHFILHPIANPPSIAVVTPSFNQAQYLETAMLSVLDQGYAPLEYVVLDGGSTDGSAGIIQRYAARLTAWESARDNGSYDAVSRGNAVLRQFEKTVADRSILTARKRS